MSHEPAACSCGAMIRWLPTPDGATMPVDVDRDPHGTLTAVKVAGRGWGVRVLSRWELALDVPQPRYNPHWAACPHAEQYRKRARVAAPETWPERGNTPAACRAGPCAVCRTVHPARYGPGPSSPLCPACRAERHLPPVF